MVHVIVGIHKCGTTSLEQYLIKKGYDVIRLESYFWGIKPERFRELYPEATIVFMLRNPLDRLWSHYNYKRYYQKGDRQEIKCGFEEALEKHPELVKHSDYKYWLDLWKPDEIYWLEDLQKQPDFPKLTVSEYKEKLTPERKRLIAEALSKL